MENEELIDLLEQTQQKIKRVDFKDMPESWVIEEIILPIIKVLGWNGDSNIIQQQKCDNGYIDILLMDNNKPKAIVEGKKGDQSLEDHKEQLSDYLECTNAKVGILTKGSIWEFYLPRFNNMWRMKKFCVLNIEDDLKTLHDWFMDYLYIDNIISPNYSRIARKKIKTYDIDNSLMGISDIELMEMIDKIRPKFPTLKPEDKNRFYDLKREAYKRKLPEEYCLF